MKYDIAAFDFDGTLADTMPWFNSILNTVADKYGFRKIDAAERDQLRHRDAAEILKFLGIPLWKLPAIMAHVRTLMQEIDPSVHMFDGIPDALVRLKAAGVRLAVVSSIRWKTCGACWGPTPRPCSTTTNVAPTCSARRPRSSGCSSATTPRRNVSCWSETKCATSTPRARRGQGRFRGLGLQPRGRVARARPRQLIMQVADLPAVLA